MYTSGGPTGSRSLPDTRKPAHVDFDLRVAFAAERRLLPALLLIGLVAAFAAMRAGANALALAWLALYGVNAAIRFLIATEYATAPREVSAETRGGKIYLATAGADVVLWSLMLALVPNAAMFVAGPGAYAAAGAVLLAALSYGGWPRVWTVYVLAWIGVFAIGALRVQGEMPTFVHGVSAVVACGLVDWPTAADGASRCARGAPNDGQQHDAVRLAGRHSRDSYAGDRGAQRSPD